MLPGHLHLINELLSRRKSPSSPGEQAVGDTSIRFAPYLNNREGIESGEELKRCESARENGNSLMLFKKRGTWLAV